MVQCIQANQKRVLLQKIGTAFVKEKKKWRKKMKRNMIENLDQTFGMELFLLKVLTLIIIKKRRRVATNQS